MGILPTVIVASSGCGSDHAGPASIDSGAPVGEGPLFAFDSGFRTCAEAGAKTMDAGRRDAGTCTPSRQVSYLGDVAPLLIGNCTGEICHNGTWGSGVAYRYVIDVPASECCGDRNLVTPGDPSGSYLMQKLHGVDLCAGQPMPYGGKLDPGGIQTLSDWICEGAPHP